MTEEDVRQVITAAQRDTKPKYDTRRNKYLIPLSMQGADGQIRGLREAIYLAIKLDRTLVLPPFFNDPWIDPEEAHFQELDPRLEPNNEEADDFSENEFEKLQSCQGENRDNCTEGLEKNRLKYESGVGILG